MDVRAYVEERYSGTTLFYSFAKWLLRWKWVILSICIALTLILLWLHFRRSSYHTYSLRLTDNMLLLDGVNLQDVYSILSVELQSPDVRKRFEPELVSSKVELIPERTQGSKDMLDVTLTLASAGNIDSVSACLRACVFNQISLKSKLLQKRQEKESQIRALDTLIDKTQMWISRVYASLQSNRSALSGASIMQQEGIIASNLHRDLNTFVLQRAQLQSELLYLSQENLTLGSLQEQLPKKALVKLAISVLAVWVSVFLVSMFIWLLRYSYEVSSVASQWQHRTALEGEEQRK